MKIEKVAGEQAMWYHKTKLGYFWIVESEDNHEYTMGLDDDSLGHYKRIEDAILDIQHQTTGHLKWDASKGITVPEDVHEWVEGEPDNWTKF